MPTLVYEPGPPSMTSPERLTSSLVPWMACSGGVQLSTHVISHASITWVQLGTHTSARPKTATGWPTVTVGGSRSLPQSDWANTAPVTPVVITAPSTSAILNRLMLVPRRATGPNGRDRDRLRMAAYIGVYTARIRPSPVVGFGHAIPAAATGHRSRCGRGHCEYGVASGGVGDGNLIHSFAVENPMRRSARANRRRSPSHSPRWLPCHRNTR